MKVKELHLHNNMFAAGIGDLGKIVKTGKYAKFPGLTMNIDQTNQAVVLKALGRTFWIPSGAISHAELEDETTSK